MVLTAHFMNFNELDSVEWSPDQTYVFLPYKESIKYVIYVIIKPKREYSLVLTSK